MRKWFAGLLAVCLTAVLATPVFAALPSGTGKITNCNSVSGSEFSSKTSIANKLDKMFAGDIGLYKDKNKTKLVDASLGTRNVPNNGVYQYWGPTPRAGTSCFAYANAFYGHFYDGVYPHHSLNSNHKVIKATGRITYENFVKWGVRDDAAVYIREGNHSVIVLTYDRNYITYVDGNGDGKGLIAIRKEAWQRGSGANIYNQKPSLIVQPTTAYFPKGNMKSNGAISCTQGGNSHDWDQGTVTKTATCKVTGQKVYTCLDCGIAKDETLQKTDDHVYGDWYVTKEATCTAKGQKTAQCSVCGKEKTKSVKALGHKYGKAVVSREATLYSAGVSEKTCERCGNIKKTKSDCVAENAVFGLTLATKEGVFPKKTELFVTGPEDPETMQIALQAVSAKTFLFELDARVEGEPVQPEGTVTLEVEIPQDFGSNLGLYQLADGAVELLESTVDPETGILSAKLKSFAAFALCDLDVPYVPEPTQPETQPVTQPETQPATQPITEPTAVPAVAQMEVKDSSLWQNRELLIWMAVAAVLIIGFMTLSIILIVRTVRKRKANKQEQSALEEPETEEPVPEEQEPETEEQETDEPEPESAEPEPEETGVLS